MAITRAQIARQLLQFGGGADMGRERGSETGREAGPGPGQGEGGGGPNPGLSNPRRPGKKTFMPTTVTPTSNISDFSQFDRRIRQNQALRGAGLLGKDLGMNIGEQSFLANIGDQIKGIPSLKLVKSFFDKFPGGTPPKTFADTTGNSQQMGRMPLWAQLGFSSEEEYLDSLEAQALSTTEQEPEVKQEEPEGLFRRFKAEGGPIGGEFDFESARQMYGLGKLVKKVTKTVKKIAKSPVGKAAIAAATIKFGGKGLAKIFPTTFGTTAKSPFLRAIGRGQFFGDTGIFSAGKTALFGSQGVQGTSGLLGAFPGGGVGAAITAASLLPFLGIGTGEESEEEAEELIRGEGLDINAIRANPNQFLARRFRAEGGSMKEPVAKKTMPLLDMGGKEMDLREEGGFVPIGRMEKADDVPARLSKNEFVFTADAVRNAGDGNVDKGAEVMYNMMKNLEAGGDVSKESQGLEGARKMFQTSQRLEEVL